MMVDEATKKTLASIPLLRTNAGPRDGDQWASRLKEEYLSLIKVILNVVTRWNNLYVAIPDALRRIESSSISTGSM